MHASGQAPGQVAATPFQSQPIDKTIPKQCSGSRTPWHVPGSVGATVGTAIGTAVGGTVGSAVGEAIGATVGEAVGVAVGAPVGLAVGTDGANVGTEDGAPVGEFMQTTVVVPPEHAACEICPAGHMSQGITVSVPLAEPDEPSPAVAVTVTEYSLMVPSMLLSPTVISPEVGCMTNAVLDWRLSRLRRLFTTRLYA